MEQNLHHEERLFLEEVTLSGYKSIFDTRITFNKGINIIIGKNAVGKTNFFTFLFKALNFSYKDLFEFKSKITIRNGKRIIVETNNALNIQSFIESRAVSTNRIKSKAFIDNTLLVDTEDLSADLKTELLIKNILLTPAFIGHGIPKDYLLVDQPFSFEINIHGFPPELFVLVMGNNNLPYFIKSILTGLLYLSYPYNKAEASHQKELIKQKIANFFDVVNTIKPYLIKISPIEDIQFNGDYNIFEDDKGRYTIKNLFLEFLIDGFWHPFSNLSDGTKRLFYIVSEVAFDSKYYFTNTGISIPEYYNISRIILIEEPELGIHPHQLHELMLFLKEQSRRKQIIITTHSPQVLDILNKDELGNIIIASYEKGEGTKLRHLDGEEIAKAQQYMEEDYLGDYWRFSDLEKEKTQATL